MNDVLGPLRRRVAREIIENRRPDILRRLAWGGCPPRDDWASFDVTPWQHPWLTVENLEAMREHGRRLRARLEARHLSYPNWRYAFVGNIGNAMYTRAVALRRQGLSIDLVLNSQDRYIMSQPVWEEFDGELTAGVPGSPEEFFTAFPEAFRPEGIVCVPEDTEWHRNLLGIGPYARWRDLIRWTPYFAYRPTFDRLQAYDAILATQYPYLAYFSGRPYIATQVGGDIWYECSRDDAFGRLQRMAFGRASVFGVSNPWSFAFARRYGFRHMTLLPFMLDDTVYSPGPSRYRDDWNRRSGGTFFVLSTARLDDYYKGSGIAFEGFAAFAARHSEARLVVIGWGKDKDAYMEMAERLGIADKILALPLAGKRRLIDYLRSADVLLDQFVLGYYGATGLEAMGCGVPVIMRINTSQYGAMCEGGAPPVLHAESAGSVAGHLTRLAEDADASRIARVAIRQWFLENHGSTRWGPVYAQMLAATARHERFDFANSPLRLPLGKAEREYHAEQMARAPSFPNYR
ncbi:MAG: glycosyltransferase [Rhodospirillaceae bacterium]